MQTYCGRLAAASQAAAVALTARSFSAQAGHVIDAQSLSMGHVLEKIATFDASDVKTFLDISGDLNPLHTCASAAQAQGFQGCIVPGILCASLFPAIIGTAFPGAVYLMQDLKFRSPGLVGEPILARVTLTGKSGSRYKFRTECLGPSGDILTDGSAIALIHESNKL